MCSLAQIHPQERRASVTPGGCSVPFTVQAPVSHCFFPSSVELAWMHYRPYGMAYPLRMASRLPAFENGDFFFFMAPPSIRRDGRRVSGLSTGPWVQ